MNDQTNEHIFFYHFLTLTLTVIFSEGSKRVKRKVIFIYINIKYYLNILSPISAASRNKNCQCQCQQNAAPESPSIAFLSALTYDLFLITLRVASPYSIFFALLTRITLPPPPRAPSLPPPLLSFLSRPPPPPRLPASPPPSPAPVPCDSIAGPPPFSSSLHPLLLKTALICNLKFGSYRKNAYLCIVIRKSLIKLRTKDGGGFPHTLNINTKKRTLNTKRTWNRKEH